MRTPSAEQRLEALERFDRIWIDSLNRDVELARFREEVMLGYALTDGECTVLGQRARLHVEWPDGLPPGFDETALRAFGEQMLTTARERLAP